MSHSDIAISVRNIAKAYTISHQTNGPGSRWPSFRESVANFVKEPFRKTPKETFWALKDVSFDVKKGDVVGIIGRNGAGKSTLLKVLSRIAKPTSGQVDVYGRIGSLLEVGTGFHPELTGRENVFLNGAILGMTRSEIRKQFDAIVDFAGVEKFLDTPVKRYSSGMYVRLAFAVAAHLESEILLIDEVLAVGDASFRNKCLGKMRDVTNAGRTVLFVSHDTGAVASLCKCTLYLQQGRVAEYDATARVLSRYLDQTRVAAQGLVQPSHRVQGNGALTIDEVLITSSDGKPQSEFQTWEPLDIYIRFTRQDTILEPSFFLLLTSADGNIIASAFQKDDVTHPGLDRSGTAVRVRIPLLPLNEGNYSISCGAFGKQQEFLDWVEGVINFRVVSGIYGVGPSDSRLGFTTHPWHWTTCTFPSDAHQPSENNEPNHHQSDQTLYSSDVSVGAFTEDPESDAARANNCG